MQIQASLEKYGKKKDGKWEIELKDYKILGKGEVKEKLIIRAKEASKSALEKVKKAGGEIILAVKKDGKEKIIEKVIEKEQGE